MRLGKVNNTFSLQNEIMSRVRQPLTDAEHGGEPCGDLSETQECNVFACDMPCEKQVVHLCLLFSSSP